MYKKRANIICSLCYWIIRGRPMTDGTVIWIKSYCSMIHFMGSMIWQLPQMRAQNSMHVTGFGATGSNMDGDPVVVAVLDDAIDFTHYTGAAATVGLRCTRIQRHFGIYGRKAGLLGHFNPRYPLRRYHRRRMGRSRYKRGCFKCEACVRPDPDQ